MYNYNDSGLDYIWLRDGYDELDTPYGKGIVIHELEELHKVIALDIIENCPDLSGHEFRFLRKELGFTQSSLGSLLGKNQQTIAIWEKEKAKEGIPVMAQNIIRGIYKERFNGNLKFEKLITRINDLDRKLNEEKKEKKLTLSNKDKHWIAKSDVA